MSYASALDRLMAVTAKLISRASPQPSPQRKAPKARTAPKNRQNRPSPRVVSAPARHTSSETERYNPPRDDSAVERLAEATHAALPEVFGPHTVAPIVGPALPGGLTILPNGEVACDWELPLSFEQRLAEALATPPRPAHVVVDTSWVDGRVTVPKAAPPPAQAAERTFPKPLSPVEARNLGLLVPRSQCTAVCAGTGLRCGLLDGHRPPHRTARGEFVRVAKPGQTYFPAKAALDDAAHNKPTEQEVA